MRPGDALFPGTVLAEMRMDATDTRIRDYLAEKGDDRSKTWPAGGRTVISMPGKLPEALQLNGFNVAIEKVMLMAPGSFS